MRQFYGHLEKCVLSAGKTMSVKFPFFGAGFGGGGWGSADFIFTGARIFLRKIAVFPVWRGKNRISQGVESRGSLTLKTLTSLNKEVRPFFLCDNSIWSFPSLSFLSDYSTWRFLRLFYPCDHSIWGIWVHCPQILLSLREKGNEGV